MYKAALLARFDSLKSLLGGLEKKIEEIEQFDGLFTIPSLKAVILCLMCDNPVPLGRDYCSNSCRQKAYRKRKSKGEG